MMPNDDRELLTTPVKPAFPDPGSRPCWSMFSAAGPAEPGMQDAIIRHTNSGYRALKTIEIGVFPEAAFKSRKRLFRALEQIYPATFAAWMPPERHFDGCVAFLATGDSLTMPVAIPTLQLPASRPVDARPARTIRFASTAALDPILRGRNLIEERTDYSRPLATSPADTVLAMDDDGPVWSIVESATATMWSSTAALDELGSEECLRERLRAGRFMGLLPVIEFLGRVCGRHGWREPPLRASIIVDDPNLHSDRYGYLRFAELAAHAEVHDYHVAMAMIPLDTWFARRRAVEIFRKARSRLSLLIHGNNHIRHELAALGSLDEAMACMGQAQRRIERFETRTGVHVARVVAPPHGACSELAMAAMLRLGLDAICVSRPYPWLDRPPREMVLAGWFPADFVAGGMPVIPRHHLKAAREDMLFRGLLKQPLILYGHHDDAASGLEVFSEAAQLINSFGPVEWCTLDRIATSNYASRLDGDCLHVRSYSNRFDIHIPDGVKEMEILSIPVHGDPERFGIDVNGKRVAAAADSQDRPDRFSARIGVTPGAVSIGISRIRCSAPQPVSAPQWRPWPFVRRILTEGRDRLRPHLGRG